MKARKHTTLPPTKKKQKQKQENKQKQA